MFRDEVRFEVLGPLRGWQGGAEIDLGSPQQRAVLAMLLLARGRQVSLKGLINGLWERDVPRAAAGTIRTYISRLRRRVDPIESIGDGYVLRLGAAVLDLDVFEQWRGRGACCAWSRRGARSSAAGRRARAVAGSGAGWGPGTVRVFPAAGAGGSCGWQQPRRSWRRISGWRDRGGDRRAAGAAGGTSVPGAAGRAAHARAVQVGPPGRGTVRLRRSAAQAGQRARGCPGADLADDATARLGSRPPPDGHHDRVSGIALCRCGPRGLDQVSLRSSRIRSAPAAG